MQIKAEFSFPEKLRGKPIICNICKEFNITLSIIEASFSTQTGWAILSMEGEEAELKRTFEHLRGMEIEINNMEQV